MSCRIVNLQWLVMFNDVVRYGQVHQRFDDHVAVVVGHAHWAHEHHQLNYH
jgi:hypothetical protein